VKITHIAAAAVVPAAIAGAAISLGASGHPAIKHAVAGTTHRAADATPAHAKSAPATSARASRAHARPSGTTTHDGITATPGQTLSRIAAVHRLRHAARLRRQAAASQPTAASQPAAPSQLAATEPGQPSGPTLTAGMSSFEQCVAWRESSDTPTDPDGLFGLLPSTWASLGYSGTAGEASVAVQKEAFSRLYAADGTAPWAPYDGC
jgi:hypothetical protein